VRRSLPHCYVAAVLGTLRRLGLDRLLSQSGRHPKQEVILCLAMIVVRPIAPVYKLATGQLLDGETATCSLGQVLGGGRPREAEAHLVQGIKPADLDFTTALRAPAIRKLVEAGDLQVSFDDRKLAEITWPDYPNERLVVYRNPVLAGERTRKRGELLDALDDIERKLRDIQTRVRPDNKPLRGQDAIGIAVGRVRQADEINQAAGVRELALQVGNVTLIRAPRG
jgi:hypothetical protein